MVVAAHRVAVFGGDGRPRPGLVDAPEIVTYPSAGYGGNGAVRRLEAALRAGTIGTLVILSRWNGHSATRKLRRLCKQLGIRIVIVR